MRQTFFQLLENYRKTRDVDSGKQLLDIYDSCENKRQLFSDRGEYLNCIRTLGQIRRQVLGINSGKELISMIEKFKTKRTPELKEKIIEFYDSLTQHHKILGDRFLEIRDFVRNLKAQQEQNLKVSPASRFLSLYEQYKETHSEELANELINFYHSIENKMKTFGTEFDRIHRCVRYLRKKLRLNTTSNNENIHQKFTHLVEKFKRNGKISTAEEIVALYESIPDHEEKGEITQLVQRLKQELQKPGVAKFIQLYRAYRETESKDVASQIVRLYQSTVEKQSEFGIFHYKIKKHVKYLRRKHNIKLTEILPECVSEPMSPGRTHAVINLSYRLEKFKIRKYLLSIAKQFDAIKAVTLPGTEWIFERDLLIIAKNLKITLIGLENDHAVYTYSKQNMPEHPAIWFLNISDMEFFSKPRNINIPKLNFIWLDYMGPFTIKRLQILQKAIENNYIDDTCVMAFTFLAGRENSDVLSIYRQYSENYKEARTIAVPLLYKDIAEKHGFKAEILKSELYKEPMGEIHTAPMLFVALKLYK